MKTHMRDAMLDVISKVGGGAALFHDIVALRISPQVMFSSDFTTKWRGKSCTVKEQGLDSLTEQAFKGIEISRLHPLFKVCKHVSSSNSTQSLHMQTPNSTHTHTHTFTSALTPSLTHASHKFINFHHYTRNNTHWANVDRHNVDHHFDD